MTQPDGYLSDNARTENWLLAAVLAVTLVPIWAVHYLPTTDGGAHLANADVVRHFLSGGTGAYGAFYELTPRLVPNWLGHFVLAVLLTVVRPAVAEKLFMSAYLILLPLSVRYAARGVKKSAGFLAFLAVPLSLNWITHQGFYNFSGSVVVFFFALGYWLRRRDRMNLPRSLFLAAFAFLLYTGHLSSILLFAATIGILAAWFTVARFYRARRAPGYSILRDGVSRILITGIALLPAVGLAVWFQRHGFAGKPPGMKLAIRNLAYWKDLLGLSFLISFHDRPEKWIARLTSLLIAGALIAVVVRKVRRRSWTRRDGLIFPSLAIIALYFLQGSQAHRDLFIPQRLTYYAALLLIPFLAAQPFPRFGRAAIICGGSALALALTAAHWRPMRAFDAQLAEYIDAGDRIARHATFLPLTFAPRGMPAAADLDGLHVTPFFSVQGYIAIDRQAVDLRNYEASYDYFPVRFRRDLDPYKFLAKPDAHGGNGLMAVPQLVDIPAYEAKVGKNVDYVLVWGLESVKPDKRDPDTLRTLDVLKRTYDLEFSSPSGRVQLWHRRPTVP